jgi:hypothetical protein
MKQLVLATIFLTFSFFNTLAQVSTLPYLEDFSRPFNTGNDAEFLPHWYGNEVEAERRIFRAIEGIDNPVMGMIPTSAFDADVQLRLDLTTYKYVSVSFKAKARKNGTGNRETILYMESSVDGGVSWLNRKEILRFANEDRSSFSNYEYILPGSTDNRNAVIVRFIATRSISGDGTAALLLVDDVQVKANENDISMPEVLGVSILDAQRLRIQFSEAMNATAGNIANYTGVPNLVSATRSGNNQQVTLTFAPDFGIGTYNTLRIAHVQDLAGNSLSQPFFFDFVYNPTTPDILISEIMYNPPETGTDSLEFLEIYNRGNSPAQLGGLYFADGIQFSFPTATLAPGAYYLIAVNARAARNQYGIEFNQWTSGALNNAGETLVIKNSVGITIDSITYSPDWGSNGDGSSLVLCDVDSDNSQGQNWSQATTPVGPRINNTQIFAHPGAACPADLSPSIRFAEGSLEVLENTGSISIAVAAINSNDQPSAIRINIDPSSTALLGTDFSSSVGFPHTLSFEPNFNGTKSIVLNIINDAVAEPLKTLILTLSHPVNAQIGSTSTFVLTLIDEDQPTPPVCINELMASNASYQTDAFGEYDDWIEIYNPGNQPVNLASYYITDNPNNLTKYRFPLNQPEKTTVPANGFLIVWADNQPEQGALHTNFALSANGEFVGLIKPNGTGIVDSVYFPGLATDISYGRSNDCGSGWIVFGRPTLGASNVSTAVTTLSNGQVLKAYPNPVRGDELFLSHPVSFELHDITGRILEAKILSNQLDVSGLNNGMYFLRTSDGISIRFIIAR